MICSASLLKTVMRSSAPAAITAGRQVLQQSLVVDFRVLDFGEQLRVIDRDRELTAKTWSAFCSMLP